MRRLYLSALGLLALAGCPDRKISEVNPEQDKIETKDIPVQLNRDVDVLFVIDNSGSMDEEQTSLATNFPVFIDRLETIEGGLPNVHLGVVSSDMGAGTFTSVCNTNDMGQLQSTIGAGWPSGTTCPTPTDPYIEDIKTATGTRQTNYTGTLADTFSCIARLGTGGCGFEQHLQSMRAALTAPNNPGFLRDTAFLAVVFIQDEDDCSVRDPQMFDTSQNSTTSQLGPLSSFRCFEFGVDCETGNGDPRAPGPRTGCFPRDDSQYMYAVQEYVDFLKSLKDDDSLIITAGIMGNPEPVTVGTDPEMPQNPALVPSCQSTSGKADPAVRIKFLLDQFPHNAFTTICNENLADALEVIAQLLKEAIGNPCIESVLKDVNPDLDGAQYECTVSDVVNPGTADQTETILPECDHAAEEDLDITNTPVSTNVPCWHLTADAEHCSTTPTMLSLIVERAGASVPTGTHVQAQCVTE